jgi:7-carboxy-7-deazaguanine synthase
MKKKFAINSIYLANEGEGIFVGIPQVMVRFQGCAIGCLNCDSKDTWEFTAPDRDLDLVMADIRLTGLAGKIKRVSITGGDPLHPKLLPACLELVKELKKEGYFINIEAAGTRITHELFDLVDFISFDFKTPSTGVITPVRNIFWMIKSYSGKFQVKSVISDHMDFQTTFDAYQTIKKEIGREIDFSWCLTPAFNSNEDFPVERFQEISHWAQTSYAPFRTIVQQHKVIYGADSTSV